MKNLKTETKRTPGPVEAFDSALDWLLESHLGSDQLERGKALKKYRHLFAAVPELLEAAKLSLEQHGTDRKGTECPCIGCFHLKAALSSAQPKGGGR